MVEDRGADVRGTYWWHLEFCCFGRSGELWVCMCGWSESDQCDIWRLMKVNLRSSMR